MQDKNVCENTRKLSEKPKINPKPPVPEPTPNPVKNPENEKKDEEEVNPKGKDDDECNDFLGWDDNEKQYD